MKFCDAIVFLGAGVLFYFFRKKGYSYIWLSLIFIVYYGFFRSNIDSCPAKFFKSHGKIIKVI